MHLFTLFSKMANNLMISVVLSISTQSLYTHTTVQRYYDANDKFTVKSKKAFFFEKINDRTFFHKINVFANAIENVQNCGFQRKID